MANSNNWGGARRGAGAPRRNLHLDNETAHLFAQAQRQAPEMTEEQIVRALAFLVSDMWALTNHAEVFSPELLSNPQWIALKQELEHRMEKIGVTACIDQIAEQYRERIETEED